MNPQKQHLLYVLLLPCTILFDTHASDTSSYKAQLTSDNGRAAVHVTKTTQLPTSSSCSAQPLNKLKTQASDLTKATTDKSMNKSADRSSPSSQLNQNSIIDDKIAAFQARTKRLADQTAKLEYSMSKTRDILLERLDAVSKALAEQTKMLQENTAIQKENNALLKDNYVWLRTICTALHHPAFVHHQYAHLMHVQNETLTQHTTESKPSSSSSSSSVASSSSAQPSPTK